MKPSRLILTTFDLPSDLRQRLEQSGAPQTQAKVKRLTLKTASKKDLAQADALISLLTDQVDTKLLDKMPKLQVVANYAVGVNNIDLEACQKRHVRVANTPDVLTQATAELALTLLLAVARRVPEGETMCRKGKFNGWAPDLLLGQDIAGRKAVLVGRGRIGTCTGQLFEALGVSVTWITREDSDREIQNKLKGAQILSLHLPYSADNHHWLNRKRISLLPTDAIVINTARGALVDEKALIQALKARKIFGAGFDVFEHEPKIPAALKALPNAVLLPHVGSATLETRRKMAELVVDAVTGVLNGQTPRNLVRIRS